MDRKAFSPAASAIMALADAAAQAMNFNPFSGGGYGPLHTKPKAWRTIPRLNRSQHWPRARSYKHAREMSPFPERPVR